MQGFQRVSFNLEDTCLDTPQAKDIFQKQVASAMADGWLDADWEANPSGNITVIVTVTGTVTPTTMKINQCQGHLPEAGGLCHG